MEINNLREFIIQFEAEVSTASEKPATKGDVLRLANILVKEIKEARDATA